MPPYRDDDLQIFAAHGTPALPADGDTHHLERDGARIWYASFGVGEPVILLHGGLGHSGNWGHQVPALTDAGYRAIVVDSRGHGRSTRDDAPYRYERMSMDVLAVMDALQLPKAALVGWSDGACVALILAALARLRVAGVFFFGCNMDPSGTKEIAWPNPLLERCLARHVADYTTLSETPDQFDAFSAAVTQMMQTQPDYTADDLARIDVPVEIVQSKHDEFIRPEHAAYLARSIPDARLTELPDVSHFAPLQRPDVFNRAMLAFVRRVLT